MAKKKRHNQKQEKALPTDARADPLTHAFKEYWRNVDAGKSHTNAAIFVMRDYGIEMNDKHSSIKTNGNGPIEATFNALKILTSTNFKLKLN